MHNWGVGWLAGIKYITGERRVQYHCVLLVSCSVPITQAREQFVNRPFRTSQKKSEKCKDHEHTQYHQEAMHLADAFALSVEKPEATVAALIDSRKAANTERSRAILKSVAEAILFCGRQCIALHGDCKSLDKLVNPGNFLSLLKLLAKYNEMLHSHLQYPAMKCVTYMSPQTQNELPEVIGKHIILRGIVQEIKEAKFYSTSADEVTSYNTEQLALCVCFVDVDSNVRRISNLC